MNEIDLLHELAPEAERLLERHITTSKEWFPHELVPWDEVIKHDPRDEWDADYRPMPDPVRRALFVNLLTEDNLPYYTTDITRLFGVDHAWGRGTDGGRPRRAATPSSSVTSSPSPAPSTPR